MKVHQVLTDETKWIKRRLWTQERRYCLLGALQAATLSSGVAMQRVEEVVAVLFPDRGGLRCGRGCLACFNDHPDTTFEEVLWVCKVADV